MAWDVMNPRILIIDRIGHTKPPMQAGAEQTRVPRWQGEPDEVNLSGFQNLLGLDSEGEPGAQADIPDDSLAEDGYNRSGPHLDYFDLI